MCVGGIDSGWRAYFLCNWFSCMFVGWRAVSASSAALRVVLNAPDILPLAWFWIYWMMLLSPTSPVHRTSAPISLIVAINLWKSYLRDLSLWPFFVEARLLSELRLLCV